MGFRCKSFRFEGWRETQYIGLKRTGKSCRLRWVNYLHPGLKRGKMTPNEERLVVELQSKWGNRWSRIARKLPGRTDNEIKNYWRTHMRKKAQESKKKKGSSSSSSSSTTSSSSSSSSSSNSSSSSAPNSPRPGDSAPAKGKPAGAEGERSFYDTGGVELTAVTAMNLEVEEGNKVYSMDDLWKEFEFPEDNCALTSQTVASPIWDYCPNDSLWCMSEEESKMLMMQQQQPVGDHHFQSFPFCNYMIG